MPANNHKYQLTQNVLFQKVMDETVILEPETGMYFTLDPIGTFIIETLQAGKTVNEVIEQVLATYQTTQQQVEADIDELLLQMKMKGLMVEH